MSNDQKNKTGEVKKKPQTGTPEKHRTAAPTAASAQKSRSAAAPASNKAGTGTQAKAASKVALKAAPKATPKAAPKAVESKAAPKTAPKAAPGKETPRRTESARPDNAKKVGPKKKEEAPKRRRNDESYVFSRSLSETQKRIMTERRERLEDAKQFRREDAADKLKKGIIAFAVTLVFIGIIVAVVVISSLGGNVTKNRNNYVFEIGKKTTKAAYKDTVHGDTLYISFNEVAELCELTMTGSTGDLRFTAKNGDWISFSPDSAETKVNGYGITMPAPANMNGTSVSVPLSFLESVLGGVFINVDENENVVRVWRIEYSDSTELEPHYVDVSFVLRVDVSLYPVDEQKYFGDTPLFTFKTDLTEYEDYMNPTGDRRDAYLMLLNKEHTVASNYEPDGLIYVEKGVKAPYWIDADVEKAIEAMMLEMKAAGYNDIYVTSGYRSYNKQSSLYNTYIDDEMTRRHISYEEAVRIVETYSALPGTSEHHTGLCVDFFIAGMEDLDETFANYEVYNWLRANAWKFGFVLRYPSDKVAVTGYAYEPWHWRFVGRYHALEMLKSGMCFEEYLEANGYMSEAK